MIAGLASKKQINDYTIKQFNDQTIQRLNKKK